jgi:hypothetical protein
MDRDLRRDLYGGDIGDGDVITATNPIALGHRSGSVLFLFVTQPIFRYFSSV